jgi:hypothetical protein
MRMDYLRCYQGVVVYPSVVLINTVLYRQLNVWRRLNGVSCSIVGRVYRVYPIIDSFIHNSLSAHYKAPGAMIVLHLT